MSLFHKLIIFCIVWGTLLYANSCPKWFPMPSDDGLVVVLPIYDESITASDMDCDGIVDTVDSDIDGDGVPNTIDAFPLNGQESIDTDGDGIGNNADSDDDNDGTVDVNDSNPLVNEVPVADAGDDRQEDINTTIVLDASSSTDDGTILTSSWVLTNKPEGSTATLSSATAQQPTFYGDKVGAYRFELTVSDGILTSSKDVLFINVGRESTLIAFDDGVHGLEPWITNGTPEGTHLLKDINIQNGSSNIQNMVDAGDVIYFSVNNNELWKSDGSEEGTVKIKTFDAYGISDFTMLGDRLYFRGNNRLWQSDGTIPGTVEIAGYYIGPSDLFVCNDILYFSARAGNYGRELWKSDGTPSGTVMIKDIYNGDTDPKDFICANSLLFFLVRNAQNKEELWKSDGTDTGTVLVKNMETDIYANIDDLTEVNGTLFFTADDGLHGRELWKSDGTQAGTVMVKDINEGSPDSYPRYLTDVNGMLYFSIYRENGTELWKSDGTEQNTLLVKRFFSDSIDNFVVLNNLLYFVKNNVELWQSDGSSDGTVPVKENLFDVIRLTNVGDTLYFYAGEVNHMKLWKSDGTTEGTVTIANVSHGSYGASDAPFFIGSNNRVYFVGDNGIDGGELWISDGTPNGTSMVKNISSNTWSFVGSDKMDFLKIGSTYYFVGNDGIHGTELWKSDGTDTGTVILKDIKKGSPESFPSDLLVMNHTLYFTAYGSMGYRSLWRSDGTELGTVEISVDIGKVENLIATDNALFYTQNGKLWVSYGTKEGTSLIRNIEHNAVFKFKAVDNLLYFKLDSALWRSDGTISGTFMLKRNILSYTPKTVFNHMIYFNVYEKGNSSQLWHTDGSISGTKIVIDNINIINLTTVDNQLYYTQNNKLYKSDESLEENVIIQELNNPLSDIMAVNDTLYYTDRYTLMNSHTRSDIFYETPISAYIKFVDSLNGELIFSLVDGNPYQLWKTNGTQTIQLTP